ncbi:MAG TPA: alpha/beta hydrolase [Acetobacteraceae bacterium]|jgi:acetyl esterase/lipase
MASRESEQLKALYRGWVAALEADPEMPLDELRRLFERWGDITAEPGGVDYIEVDAGSVPAMWAVPKGCDPSRVLLCAHGGGYVVGSMYTHRKIYGHVAKAVGCRALIVHYGRAPENVHPGPVDDMVTAYKWLLDAGVQSAHVALIGDSAGGGLAITTILRARERGLPLPAASMPLSPWLDMEAKGETFETNRERDVLVTRDIIGTMAGTFLGEHGNRRDPLANPLHADLRGLPPLYIQTGADEALLTDSRDLAESARRSGVHVTLEVVPEMQHVFQFLAGTAPEADAAIARLAKWVRPHLGLGG